MNPEVLDGPGPGGSGWTWTRRFWMDPEVLLDLAAVSNCVTVYFVLLD